MGVYDRELAALKRAGRFRTRRLYDAALIDAASNDYLGLAGEPLLMERATARLHRHADHAPKASMLVNGYHPLHRDFERALARANGFAAGVLLGSGFLANIALIEALVRRGDAIVFDSEFHASGILASRLCSGDVRFFRHNDPHDLEAVLRSLSAKRVFVAIEGIYSMSGDLAAREIFDIATRRNALLIVDEAHSSGVLGAYLTGIFDHYGITPDDSHIKMGTLGKAYGSYGAYILASREIISFLENRAKSLIYSTALSLFDTALAHESFRMIRARRNTFRRAVDTRIALANAILGTTARSPIIAVEAPDIATLAHWHARLRSEGFLVGAIRPPTVPRPMLRIIARTAIPLPAFRRLLTAVARLAR